MTRLAALLDPYGLERRESAVDGVFEFIVEEIMTVETALTPDVLSPFNSGHYRLDEAFLPALKQTQDQQNAAQAVYHSGKCNLSHTGHPLGMSV
jgi:hypothetical protein